MSDFGCAEAGRDVVVSPSRQMKRKIRLPIFYLFLVFHSGFRTDKISKNNRDIRYILLQKLCYLSGSHNFVVWGVFILSFGHIFVVWTLFSACAFRHFAGEHPSFSLNIRMKWLGDMNPEFSEISAMVCCGAPSSRCFAYSMRSPVIQSRN